MSTATRARRTTGTAPSPPARKPVLADEGIIVAIVAVTATEDSVQDVIVPGAFTATLKKRRPKVCFNHSWEDPIGRVLHVQEWLPGDRRLPKRLPDGRAWPREAGALVATMQFHLNTTRGRDMFEHAKQWAENGEACFSIGYKVNPKRTTRRGDGVRMIGELELFEISLVLFGAHDMALALEVKAGKPTPFILNDPDATNWVEQAGGLPAYIREVANALVRDRGFTQEHAIATAVNRMERWAAGLDDVEPDTVAKAAAALAEWEAMKAKAGAEMQAKSLGLETQDAPVAVAKVVDPGEPVQQPDFSDGAMVALYPSPEAAAKIAVDGGLPADDLHITLAFLGDAAGLDGEALAAQLSEAVADTGALAGNVGGIGMFPPGDNGVPLWATVDVPRLDQLRVLITDALEAAGQEQQSEHGFTPHMTLGYDMDGIDPLDPVPVEFTEATLVVGTEKWPLSLVNTPPPAAPAAGPPMEGKAASMVALARAIPPRMEGKAARAVGLARALPPTQETKMMPHDGDLAGSFQSITRALSDALEATYRKDLGGDGDGPTMHSVWVHVEATFPGSVIYTVTDETRTGDDARQTYQSDYTVNQDGTVDLGEPEPVALTVAVVPEGGESDAEALFGDAAGESRFMLPLVDMLRGATSTLAASPEVKGLADAVRPAMEALLDQLAVKGLSYTENDDDDWSDVLEDDEEDPDADPEAESDEDAEPGEGTVEMDPAELDADLAGFADTDEDDEESR